MEGIWENVKYIINLGLYLAHYDEYFHINDDAKSKTFFRTFLDLY